MSTPPATRSALRAELAQRLQRDLDVLEAAHRATLEAATHEEAKPENDKDTRALEQSYLARGQAMRIEEMRRAVGEVGAMTVGATGDASAVGLGALVEADEDGTARWLYVAAHGGGIALASGRVQVVTTSSPLGRALVGREVGDAVEVDAGGRTRTLEIVEIH